jgi:hypothetical protein
MFGSSRHAAGICLVVIAAAALAAAPVQGASLAQQGAGAGGGLDNWYVLAPGEQAEWVFQYLGNNDPGAVALGVNPAHAVVMNIYNNEQWRALGAGDHTIVPVGKGTSGTLNKWQGDTEVIHNGSLFWEGLARPPVTFHIQVINTSQQPAQYWITQIGSAAGGLSAVSPVHSAGAVQEQPPATPTAQPQRQVGEAAAQAQTPAGAVQPVPAPHTLPVSGGAVAMWLLEAGAALSLGGWLMRRGAR